VQVTLYGDDFRHGVTAEWTVIPRVGEQVIRPGADGEIRYRVSDVVYHINDDGTLHSVIVDLDAAAP